MTVFRFPPDVIEQAARADVEFNGEYWEDLDRAERDEWRANVGVVISAAFEQLGMREEKRWPEPPDRPARCRWRSDWRPVEDKEGER